ncbi:polysaccharide biosynthesis tyrosine autokinase [Algoriphagus marincola]|jgi:capsular exopolysaccharide synthesis family protein|uniref:non-specific protein-tyrosine kinase n=1 Tax=Algoriphagus marincola TaxID=264027 RepID=A0ABS7N4J0_9BACT|nr:tyrosine-protein kinase [Algoriphagus marincola]MBY5950901.1 polysaccharide biosynthesis tyrosine autokinase [Algoriphagus marincola]
MSVDQEENDFLQEEESTFDLKAILPKILRIWPWILGSLLISLGIAFYITQTTPPNFRVSSKFFIKENEKGLSLFENPAMMQEQGMGLTNETIILRSRPIAKATLEKLDFQVEYYQQGTFILQEIYKKTPIVVEVDWKSPQLLNGQIKVTWTDAENYTIEFPQESYTQLLPDGSYDVVSNLEPKTFKFGEWVETPQLKVRINNTAASNEGNSIFILRDQNYLVNVYSLGLIVELSEKGSSILDLSLMVRNRAKGETYLNALMETYLELELQEKNEIANRTIDFIDSQVAGVADSLSSFEDQLQDYRSSNQIFNLSTESSAVFDQLTDIERQIAEASLKRRYYQSLKDYLVRENYNEIVVPSGLGIDDPYLNGLIENLLEVQVERSRLLATQTELSPQVRAANQRLADLNTSIQEILTNVESNNLMTINDLENRKKTIESSFRSLPQAEQNLIKYQRQATLTENIYNFLSEKRAESAISKASNTPANKIIEYARAGMLQISPKPTRNYLLAGFAGLFLPVLVVFALEFFRTKIEEPKYLERKLKIPVLSTILFNKTKENLVVFGNGKSGIAEGFRSLRSNIKFLVPKEKQLTFMITSTISGEGKTFCAMNLASVYSLTGKKTILIGCDMRKPKIYDDFGLKNDIGLSTYLSGQEDEWSKVVKHSNYENLDLIVAGPIPPNPSELLFSVNFEKLINELKAEYDVIILDTPPVGLVSETLDLLTLVDFTLFVFRQNYSDKSFIDAVNGLKEQKGVKNIYAIFNGLDATKVSYGGYGYSYGYGYGYYDTDKKQKKRFRI